MQYIRDFSRDICARNVRRKVNNMPGVNLRQNFAFALTPSSPRDITWLEPAIQWENQVIYQQSTSKKHTTIVISKLEPVIRSCNTSQQIDCCDCCQLIITRMPKIEDVTMVMVLLLVFKELWYNSCCDWSIIVLLVKCKMLSIIVLKRAESENSFCIIISGLKCLVPRNPHTHLTVIFWKFRPCPIHRNWVDSSKALDDSTQFACYVSTWFARSHISQIYFRHDESTTGETIRVNSIESSRIDDIFNPPCIAHRKSRSIKQRKITIREPSSFLKRGHKPRSIPTIRVDWIEFSTHSQSRSTVWNRVHESISSLSNRKYQRRIDSSWVYWTTLGNSKGEEVESLKLIGFKGSYEPKFKPEGGFFFGGGGSSQNNPS